MKRRRKTHRRGRTRPERGALLDALLGEVLPLPGAPECLFIDVGFGDDPTTTVRTHAALVRLKSSLGLVQSSAPCSPHPVHSVGVEAEKERVERAQKQSHADMSFVTGGFDLRAIGLENASLVRCLNVLRGYSVWDVKPALLQMSRALLPGGILMEGTSDVEGTLATVHVWRRNVASRLDYEGLVCVADFSRGFSPWMFRDVLPRDLRRHAVTGEPVYEWFAAWDKEVRSLRAKRHRENQPRTGVEVNRSVFVESVERLSTQSPETEARFASRGVVLWKPARPSTRPEVLCPDDCL